MAVVANEDGDLMMQDPLGQESGLVVTAVENGEEEEEEEEEMAMEELKTETNGRQPMKQARQASRADPTLRKEMETCFGFDDVSIEKKNEKLTFPKKLWFRFLKFMLLFNCRTRKRTTGAPKIYAYFRQFRNNNNFKNVKVENTNN